MLIILKFLPREERTLVLWKHSRNFLSLRRSTETVKLIPNIMNLSCTFKVFTAVVMIVLYSCYLLHSVFFSFASLTTEP
jgi:F0F1-type ATP synthase assembly protein I